MPSKHGGFPINSGGEAPVAPHDTDGRRRLAEYLLRAPFSLQKITWNPDTKTVICRSRHSWHTKRHFEVFKATDFLAAAIQHIPPKGQQRPAAISGIYYRRSRTLHKQSQTIRYYGLYSNKSRGLARLIAALVPASPEPSSPNFKSSISNLESEVLLSLPQPAEPPFDIEKRRGIGDVLDAGESNEERQTACRQPEGQAKRSQPGARRESPPGGAGE